LKLTTGLKLRYVIATFLCCLLLFSTGRLAADDLNATESEFRKLYEHQLLSLKNPNSAKTIEFDSSRNLVSKAISGPWSTCGLLQVAKINVGSRRVEISGNRVILALRDKDAQTGPKLKQVQVTPVVTDRRVRITVELSTPPTSISVLNDALSQVFEGGQLLDRVANYWKPNTDDLQAFRKNTPNEVVGELEGGRPVYLVTPAPMQPPRPIHTPDPEYTATARQKLVTGIATLLAVINEQGVPEVLEVVKGLGEGLDTQALVAVADWRFRPAVKDGKPVAVMINVDVSFKLY
jgi:TonB family protein